MFVIQLNDKGPRVVLHLRGFVRLLGVGIQENKLQFSFVLSLLYFYIWCKFLCLNFRSDYFIILPPPPTPPLPPPPSLTQPAAPSLLILPPLLFLLPWFSLIFNCCCYYYYYYYYYYCYYCYDYYYHSHLDTELDTLILDVSETLNIRILIFRGKRDRKCLELPKSSDYNDYDNLGNVITYI